MVVNKKMKRIKIRKILDENKDENRFKVPLKLSIDMLNMILAYVVSDSENINRGNLVNVRKLFNIIDERLYEVDYELMARFKFVKRALNAKLDDYIENPTVLLETCRSRKYAEVEDEIIEDVSNMKLRAGDLKRVTSLISDKLAYSFLYKYKNPLSNLIARLDNGEYESFKNLKKEFKRNLSSLLNEIRKVENLEDSGTMFSLADEMFDSVVSKTVKQLQKSSNQLRTNIRALNETMNGGAEGGRVYTILGLSGGLRFKLTKNLFNCWKNFVSEPAA